MSNQKRSGILGFALYFSCFSVDLVALDSDREQPIQIEADIAVRDERAGETRYEGNVILTQGSLRITADLISIKHDSAAADKILATGEPATLVQQPASDQAPVDASARQIEYIRSEDLVRLIDEARIAQDGSVLSGDRIEYLVTQRKVKAAGTPGAGGEGRVEVVIPPENLRRPPGND
jgi:lipopolysaccharide export system protein LptA